MGLVDEGVTFLVVSPKDSFFLLPTKRQHGGLFALVQIEPLFSKVATL
jgi:hypothetical protein